MDKSPSIKSSLHLKLIFARFYKTIFGLLILIIMGAGYYFILAPKYHEAGQASRTKLTLAQTELEKRKQYYADLQQLVANYQKISPAEIQKLKLILPQGKDIPGLLVQFQALATKNNLLLSSLNFNDATGDNDKAKIKTISISVELFGGSQNSYTEIKNFISSIETNLRLFDVDSVFFSPDSANYSLTIFTYYY